MNLEIIKSEQFRHAFKIWWDNWKIEKNKYSDIREWWDLAKNKIKLLTMEISRNLNCKQNKKEIDRLERKLYKLKLIAGKVWSKNQPAHSLSSQCHTCYYRLSF
jgi:hypothetical protein